MKYWAFEENPPKKRSKHTDFISRYRLPVIIVKNRKIAMLLADFVKNKSRVIPIKNIKTLAQQCDIPLTTFYRYMRGDVVMPCAAQEAISSALRLSQEEAQEFAAILQQSSRHKPMSRTFQLLDDLVFPQNGLPEETGTGGDVLYYNKDRHLISSSKLVEHMLARADAPNFRCSLKLVHGADMSYFPWLSALIDKLTAQIPMASVEHLIALPEKNGAGSLQTLFSVLPLLKY